MNKYSQVFIVVMVAGLFLGCEQSVTQVEQKLPLSSEQDEMKAKLRQASLILTDG